MTQEEFNQYIIRSMELIDAKYEAKFEKLMYSVFGLGVGIIMALIGIIALFIRG